MNPESINQLEWGSHLPAVLACFASTSGPILELGIGHCSTPALHALCLASDRQLTSVEQDESWFAMFRSKYEKIGHRFIKGEYVDVLPELAKQKWGVVLIDNSPGGPRRLDDFKTFLPCSDFVVVHDYEKDNQEAIEPHLNGLMRYVCRTYRPPTLIASETRDIPRSIVNYA